MTIDNSKNSPQVIEVCATNLTECSISMFPKYQSQAYVTSNSSVSKGVTLFFIGIIGQDDGFSMVFH